MLRSRGSKRRLVIFLIFILVLVTSSQYYHLVLIQRPNVLVSPLPSREKSSLFIAANLYNNENILEHWMSQVDRLVEWAGPTRTYISIYENGSQDRTKVLLKEWQSRLADRHVQHTIILDDTPRKLENDTTTTRRIARLAEIRNQALAPLHRTTMTYDKILFLNDIVFDASDAITLLNTRDGDYDAACGMDFYGQFYDTFATREVNGRWVASGNYPYFSDDTSRALLRASKPVPVYSCWNGMVALRAEPFIQNKVAFRAIIPKEPDPPLEASECCLIFIDLRAFNYTKVYINPRVKVAYDAFHYWYAHHILSLWEPFLSIANRRPSISLPSAKEAEWMFRLNASYGMGVEERDLPCLWMNR